MPAYFSKSGNFYAWLTLLVFSASFVLLFVPTSLENASTAASYGQLAASPDFIYDLAFAQGKVLAAASNGLFERKSNQSGWEKLHTGKAFLSVVGNGEGNLWAVGEQGSVVYSLDSGKTWQEKNLGNFSLFGVSVAEGKKAVAVGERGKIFFTEDGANWVESSLAVDLNLEDAELFADGRAWACGEEGSLWHSRNFGKNWEKRFSPVKTTLYSIFFANSLEGWVVGAGGTILHTGDGGNSWEKLSAPVPANLLSVQVKGDYGLIAGSGGLLLESFDYGRTWVQLETNLPKVLDLTTVEITDADSLRALVASRQGLVLKVAQGKILFD